MIYIFKLQQLEFESIRHMLSGDVYDVFARVIGMMNLMIQGHPYQVSPIHSGDFECLSDLISDYLNNIHSDFIPLYVHKLFANIVQNVNKIQLEIFLMEMHDEYAKYKQFGYRMLKPLFFIDDMINFSKFLQIFNRDLQQIVIFKTTVKEGFQPSIHLKNYLFLEQILCGISEINESIALKSVFNEILIVEPFDSIDDFIDEKQDLFGSNGWELKKTKYEDKKRNYIKSDNVLSIRPL